VSCIARMISQTDRDVSPVASIAFRMSSCPPCTLFHLLALVALVYVTPAFSCFHMQTSWEVTFAPRSRFLPISRNYLHRTLNWDILPLNPVTYHQDPHDGIGTPQREALNVPSASQRVIYYYLCTQYLLPLIVENNVRCRMTDNRHHIDVRSAVGT
jgi:hypothetical protein